MKNKSAKTASEKAFGDRPRSTRGAAKSSSGYGISNAKNAGVVVEMPAPDWMRNLAEELAPPSSADADRRMPFQKKYDIRGNAAHMTSETFRELFATYGKLALLMKRVDSVVIDNRNGLQMVFRNGVQDNRDEPVTTHDILNLGAFGALKGRKSAMLRSGKTNGVLTMVESTEALVAHDPRVKGVIHSTALGNFSSVFANYASLRDAVQKNRPKGLEIRLAVDFNSKRAGRTVGTLMHIDDAGIDPATLPVSTRQVLAATIPAYYDDPDVKLFGKSAGLLIAFNKDRKQPVAVLLRPLRPELNLE